MPQGHRPDRVGDQIRQEVSILLRRAVHDPGIGFVTVTRVQVTPDLQLARVFYTTLGTDAAAPGDGARAAAAPSRSCAARSASACSCAAFPVLEFVFDKSIENQERVEQLLHEIHEADAASAANTTDETPVPPNHDADRNDQD